jgi:hypothetical protein
VREAPGDLSIKSPLGCLGRSLELGAFGEDCLSPRFAQASSAAAQFKFSTEAYPEGAAQRERFFGYFLGKTRK